MSKVRDNWKNITLSDFDTPDQIIADKIYETLKEKGIEASAFTYSIDIDYMEIEDEKINS